MSTKDSPLEKLQAEADRIAGHMKAACAGRPPGMSIAQYMLVKAKPNFKVGIAMDDKVIHIDIAWSKIRETEEAALAEYVLGLMRETIKTTH